MTPGEIPKLLAKLDEGYDLVVGWKHGRLGNEPLKAMPSKVYNRFKGFLFGLRLRDSNHALTIHRADANRSRVRPRGALGFVYYSVHAVIAHQCRAVRWG